ncbi:MAG: GAF domain-containing protein [Chloroflexota bacterium]|nr:GAF domain-containing protein [Chloroflexota bacterium]
MAIVERRLDTLIAVNEVGISLLGMEEVLHELLYAIMRGLNSHLGVLWLCDEERTRLVAKAATMYELGSLSLEDLDIDATVPAIAEVLRLSHSVMFDEEHYPFLGFSEGLQCHLREKGVRSVLCVPLKTRGKLVGAVCVVRLIDEMFTEEDGNLFEMLAEQAAAVIEFRRINEELEKRTTETEKKNTELAANLRYLNILQDVTEVGISQLDGEEMYREMLRRVMLGLDADVGGIWLADGDSGKMIPKTVVFPGAVRMSEEGIFGDGVAQLIGELSNAGQPVFTSVTSSLTSVPVSETLIDFLVKWRIESISCVPFSGRGRLSGGMCIGWMKPVDFYPERKMFLSLIADGAAGAIGARKLNEDAQLKTKALEEKNAELQETTVFLNTLQSVTSVGLSKMGVEEVFQELLDRLVEGTGAMVGGIWLIDDMASKLEPKVLTVTEGEVSNLQDLTLDLRGAIAEGLEAGQPLLLEHVNLSTFAVNENAMRLVNSLQIQSLLGMPLKSGNKSVGLACCGWKEPQTFTENQVKLLEVIADRAATAIETRDLSGKLSIFNKELQSSIKELEDIVAYLNALEAITEVGLSQMGTDEMLSELINRFVERMGSDLGAIWLMDDDTGLPVPKATVSEVPVNFSALMGEVGEGQIAEQIRSGKRLVVEDVKSSAEFAGNIGEVSPELSPCAILGAPLKTEDRPFGLVTVLWFEPRKFTTEEVGLLEVIADRAAVAIEARRLSEGLHFSNEILQATNEELKITAENLENSNRVKSEFLANMSHELRTPLNAIIGYTSLILRQRYGRTTAKQEQALRRIEDNSKTLLSLINSVLDLSKMEAGRMPVYYEAVCLQEVIDETAAVVEPMRSEANLSFNSVVGDDIPLLWTDRGKLKQILLNLVGNAVKFTKEGGIEVMAERIQSDGNVRIIVKDTGVGMNKEDMITIFDAFKQVDGSATREQGGTGLGLAIAKMFANLLEGDLTVDSEYGVGTTFTLILPCNQPPGDKSSQGASVVVDQNVG